MRDIFRRITRINNGISVTIATKLILGFLLIIVIISVVFVVVGIQLISDRIVAEAQEKVHHDLNAARVIYKNKLDDTYDVVRFTARRFFIRDALLANNLNVAMVELLNVKTKENLDFIGITDKYGYVICCNRDAIVVNDYQGHDEIIRSVLLYEKPVASTIIVSGQDLSTKSPDLAEQAYFKLIDTPLARSREDTEETSGMMLKAAAPIFDYHGKLMGVVFGEILLNRNFEIVDKIKQTVYENVVYEGQDIGTATIFQDDVRISTNVRNKDGSRAIGTRVSEEVYNQVMIEGEPWIGRAYVVNNWYITAYEPIRDIGNRIVGMLYVGVLEQKYIDIRQQTILTFLLITFAGSLVTLIVSYFIAQKLLIPINKLVSASKQVAQGNLDVQVKINTNDELQYLADSFNQMALSLKKREEQMRDFATQKIMESERLALIGQLSANVAHELNNPLTGIVTYSHLLLEDMECEDPNKDSIEKIVGQARRCRDIIRGLLDFSRQRTPDKSVCDVNSILEECISLVENQALFHNIEIGKNFIDDMPMIVIDPSQIERVFMNIIINAAEAMDGVGKLTVQSRFNPQDEIVEIMFTDTGPGIKKENKEKIFDPFFTTKDVGHGTGLGLAISYGIIKSHKGAISVESEVGQGSTFTVQLPINPKDEAGNNGKWG
jgi:two-component system NtrC family sensor kinase